MILETLTIHNFGVYQKRQVCELATTAAKPVVLIGGLNGAGKSTFMDAIQLALYGKRARCSNRGRLAYDTYLNRCIHKTSSSSEGAGIELQFRYQSEGVSHTYQVNRCWTAHHGGVKEHLDVLLNGARSQTLTDSWDDHIESLIPIDLSELFFFDGERIEALADLERSADFLKTALQSLLGLRLINRLESDLRLVEQRKTRNVMPRHKRDIIDDLTAQITQLSADLDDETKELAEARTEHEALQQERDEVEREFERRGGSILEKRSEIESAKKEAEEGIKTIEGQLRNLAAGPTPLLLVRELLASLHEQDITERHAATSAAVDGLLRERDESLLAELAQHGAPNTLHDAVNAFLGDDRKKRQLDSTQRTYLGLSPNDRFLLDNLVTTELDQAEASLNKSLNDVASAQQRVNDTKQALDQVPDEDSLADLIIRRSNSVTAVDEQAHRLKTLKEAVDGLEKQIARLLEQRRRKEEEAARDFLDSADAGRVVTYSAKTRATLATFRTRVIQSHLTNIEALIIKSFQALARKRSIITGLRIHPETFELSLSDSDQRPLPADRLSAGERQLLAVAILWGLRRASSRPLPVVIDTPLGRLDSRHRGRIVDHYFRNVSQQVILLSTDEEIDQEHHEQLAESISHHHLLTFDEAVQATTISPGYFW